MLEVAEVSKRFGDRIALDGVSFAIRAGEVFGFVGANGAGKTTTMRIMLGVLRADAGRVAWQGTAIDAERRAGPGRTLLWPGPGRRRRDERRAPRTSRRRRPGDLLQPSAGAGRADQRPGGGIISAGRMVATGSVEELRSGGEIVIDVRGPRSPGWAAAVPGVTVLDHAGDHTWVQLGEGIDDQQVLRAALAAEPVHEFSRHRPGLSELYRDVVSAPQRAERVPVTA